MVNATGTLDRWVAGPSPSGEEKGAVPSGDPDRCPASLRGRVLSLAVLPGMASGRCRLHELVSGRMPTGAPGESDECDFADATSQPR